MADVDVRLAISGVPDLALRVQDGDPSPALALDVPYVDGGVPYAGPYEVIPSNVAQVLPIGGRKATRDVSIAAIPSNYGLITWDGSTLTVS